MDFQILRKSASVGIKNARASSIHISKFINLRLLGTVLGSVRCDPGRFSVHSIEKYNIRLGKFQHTYSTLH